MTSFKRCGTALAALMISSVPALAQDGTMAMEGRGFVTVPMEEGGTVDLPVGIAAQLCGLSASDLAPGRSDGMPDLGDCEVSQADIDDHMDDDDDMDDHDDMDDMDDHDDGDDMDDHEGGGNGNDDDDSRQDNNGFGNGNQDAPGNSRSNNNAENDEDSSDRGNSGNRNGGNSGNNGNGNN